MKVLKPVRPNFVSTSNTKLVLRTEFCVCVNTLRVFRFSFTAIHAAVSYTHLDVYKRQLLHCTQRGCWHRNASTHTSSISSSRIVVIPSSSCVSTNRVYHRILTTWLSRDRVYVIPSCLPSTRHQRSIYWFHVHKNHLSTLLLYDPLANKWRVRCRYAPVSYTHLDVYKRQVYVCIAAFIFVIVRTPSVVIERGYPFSGCRLCISNMYT